MTESCVWHFLSDFRQTKQITTVTCITRYTLKFISGFKTKHNLFYLEKALDRKSYFRPFSVVGGWTNGGLKRSQVADPALSGVGGHALPQGKCIDIISTLPSTTCNDFTMCTLCVQAFLYTVCCTLLFCISKLLALLSLICNATQISIEFK